MSAARTTTDHGIIRKWAEQRGGRPAAVAATHEDDAGGLLKIDFGKKEDTLDEISWDEFFETFEDARLGFPVSGGDRKQEERAGFSNSCGATGARNRRIGVTSVSSAGASGLSRRSLRSPPFVEFGLHFRVRRIKAENRISGFYSLGDEVLHERLLVPVARNFVSEMSRNHHDPLAISHDHVPRIDRHLAATDGNIDVQ